MPDRPANLDEARRPVVVWFRDDLRLGDNPALVAAVQCGRPIIALYILEEDGSVMRPLGAAARWWLHHSLSALDQALQSRSRPGEHPVRLVLRRGQPAIVLKAIRKATQAARLVWNRTYEPARAARDERLAVELRRAGWVVDTFPGALLAEPQELCTASGAPYRVFTAFWNRLSTLEVARPVPAPRALRGSAQRLAGERLEAWRLLPRADWGAGFARSWIPGERGAARRLRTFLANPLRRYRTDRDVPQRQGTSRLSPHLTRGELSARALWHAVLRATPGGQSELIGHGFLRELAWREFSQHLLYHFPELPHRPLRREFEAFRWRTDPAGLTAWQQGRTGYPIVDAGMRELWNTGWMHNRVRMICASFLVKDLLLDWRCGEAWFWDTLVDADPASNAVNWQWVAGCGVDAAPYFRIFNPLAQSKRFDPRGRYLRAWIPELHALPDALIHSPWTAAPDVLTDAGLRLGETYPLPLVDHPSARREALERFARCRRAVRRG